MARWDELFLEPAAPVLLRGLTVAPTRARYDDFELERGEVNPVLGQAHRCWGIGLTAGGGRSAGGGGRSPRIEIIPRQVIGTFTYAKLPMVRDMEAAGDLLAESDLVAAVAGDPEAQRLVAAEHPARENSDAPEDDYSVLDADSSQRHAIDTVLAGQSLVIHGPPGTGKSQTIANLIAALVAHGRKVLFVAEKRAAIDAVLSRLQGVELGDMVLDIHEGTRDRQRIARDLGATLDLATHSAPADAERLHRRLADRVQRLSKHVSALHEVHKPWGLTPFGVQAALLGIPAAARTSARLPAPERLDAEAAEVVRDEIREFAHLGGFTLRPYSTPWYAALIRTAADAHQARELAATLDSETLPMFANQVEVARAGLRRREDFAAHADLMRLFAGIEQTLHTFDPAVYASSPALNGRRHRRRDRARPARTTAAARPGQVAVDRAVRAQALLGGPARGPRRGRQPAGAVAGARRGRTRPAAAAFRLPAADPAVRGGRQPAGRAARARPGAARARRRR